MPVRPPNQQDKSSKILTVLITICVLIFGINTFRACYKYRLKHIKASFLNEYGKLPNAVKYSRRVIPPVDISVPAYNVTDE